MIVVFLGPPGSGKGTQAKRICKQLGLIHLSTGDLFREAIAQKTQMGLQAKTILDRGELVSDDVVVGLVREKFQNSPKNTGFILDGFPRTIQQATALDQLIAEQHFNLAKVILFDVKDSVLMDRLSGRRVCDQCGTVFHMTLNPPSSPERCDACKVGKLVHRPDDQVETIHHRLQVYQRQTAPLVDFYKQQNKLITIDGSQAPEVVERGLLSSLKTSLGNI